MRLLLLAAAGLLGVLAMSEGVQEAGAQPKPAYDEKVALKRWSPKDKKFEEPVQVDARRKELKGEYDGIFYLRAKPNEPRPGPESEITDAAGVVWIIKSTKPIDGVMCFVKKKPQ